MGIFNFFIVLPEILAALTFGPLVKHLLGGNLVHAVMAGGVFMLLAAVLAQWVEREGVSNIQQRTSNAERGENAANAKEVIR